MRRERIRPCSCAMRAFNAEREVGPADADGEKKEGEVKRIVSLKKRSRDDVANGDAEDTGTSKKGVRGRGAATYLSSVAVSGDEGPRREPPDEDPSRVLKVFPPTSALQVAHILAYCECVRICNGH